jgi:hypothetical protein
MLAYLPIRIKIVKSNWGILWFLIKDSLAALIIPWGPRAEHSALNFKPGCLGLRMSLHTKQPKDLELVHRSTLRRKHKLGLSYHWVSQKVP